jgi:hypothetical protein
MGRLEGERYDRAVDVGLDTAPGICPGTQREDNPSGAMLGARVAYSPNGHTAVLC